MISVGSFSTLVPDVTALLALEPRDLAGMLLIHMNSLESQPVPMRDRSVQKGQINRRLFNASLGFGDDLRISRFRPNIRSRGNSADCDRRAEVEGALSAAWVWLEDAGLITCLNLGACDYILHGDARWIHSQDDFKRFCLTKPLPRPPENLVSVAAQMVAAISAVCLFLGIVADNLRAQVAPATLKLIAGLAVTLLLFGVGVAFRLEVLAPRRQLFTPFVWLVLAVVAPLGGFATGTSLWLAGTSANAHFGHQVEDVFGGIWAGGESAGVVYEGPNVRVSSARKGAYSLFARFAVTAVLVCLLVAIPVILVGMAFGCTERAVWRILRSELRTGTFNPLSGAVAWLYGLALASSLAWWGAIWPGMRP